MAVAVAVSGGVAVSVAVPVALPVAGLTKRFFNQTDFLINVWGYFDLLDKEHPSEKNSPDAVTGPELLDRYKANEDVNTTP